MLLKKGIVRTTFIFSALLILLVTLISFAVMYFTMPGYYLSLKEKTLQKNLDSLTAGLRSAISAEQCSALIASFSEENNATVISFDKDEAVLPMLSTPFVNMEMEGDTVFFAGGRTEASGEGKFTIQIKTERIMVNEVSPDSDNASPETSVALRMIPADNSSVITLQGDVGGDVVDHILASGTLQPIDEAKDVILSLIPYVLIIAIAVGIVLAGTYARQITKPILQLSDAALRMQRMEPDAVSAIKTDDELGQLSANLDAMYSSLRENIEHLKAEMDKVNRLERSKTEMMQSASHELKTPVAALSGMIEGMIDNIGVYRDKEKYLAQCKAQVDKLSELIGEILGAARADIFSDSTELSDEFVDRLVERAISENMYHIREKKLKLVCELPSLAIRTDPDMFYRAISNLVSNAVLYTPPAGEIRISVTGEGEQRRLLLENECDPIPDDELQKLFEPFYTRSYSRDKSASGTGLGLYIAARSLERLGIHYQVESAGLGFRISLKI